MKHCLRLSSFCFYLFFCAACSNPYKNLTAWSAQPISITVYKPQFEKIIYRCVVDGKFLFKKFHLSGILFIKSMPDSSVRIVFQNEMGLSFFDFEFTQNDSFRVNQIISQLDKSAVVKTLKKDFQMLLIKGFDMQTEKVFYKDECKTMGGVGCPDYYYRLPLDKGFVYYFVDKQGVLRNIEDRGKSKIISIALLADQYATVSDKVYIYHHKAHFGINLTKIKQDAAE